MVLVVYILKLRSGKLPFSFPISGCSEGLVVYFSPSETKMYDIERVYNKILAKTAYLI